MNKQCTKCNQSKPLDAFRKDRTHRDGRATVCKECRKNYRSPNPCSIEDCQDTVEGNGYCRKHNYRFKRYGQPTGFPVPVIPTV